MLLSGYLENVGFVETTWRMASSGVICGHMHRAADSIDTIVLAISSSLIEACCRHSSTIVRDSAVAGPKSLKAQTANYRIDEPMFRQTDVWTGFLPRTKRPPADARPTSWRKLNMMYR